MGISVSFLLYRARGGEFAREGHITCEYICAEDRADNVAQMGDVVYIGQGAGDEDVPLTLLGEDLLFCRHGLYIWWVVVVGGRKILAG